jgi:hypothetical protein
MRPVQKLPYTGTPKQEFLASYAAYVKRRLRKFKIKKKKADKAGFLGIAQAPLGS